MFDVIGMIKSVADVTGKIMDRIWGGRTSEQDRLEKDLTNALEQKKQAMDRGDLAAANQWDAVAAGLRREIAAKYPG